MNSELFRGNLCGMQKVLTAAEIREVDRLTTEEYGIPSLLLMENAAHAVARVITKKLGGSVKYKKFLILCGKGNNGGDGLALARILWTQGANVSLCLTAADNEMKGDARKNLEVFRELHRGQKIGEPALCLIEVAAHRMFFDSLHNYFDYNVVIDALFGTGLTAPLRNDFALLAKAFGSAFETVERPIFLSIDIPSGLDANNADVIGPSLLADLTVTFTAPKPANILPPASNFNGELTVANIGSPLELIVRQPSQIFLAEKSDAKRWLENTSFSADSYKNKRGHALLIAGSKDYSGAAVLCGNAAMRSGAGLVTVMTNEMSYETVASRVLPEVIVKCITENEDGSISDTAFSEVDNAWQKADAVAVGSGLSFGEQNLSKFIDLLVEKRRTPMIIDASALNALSPFKIQGSNLFPLILTPHEGEFLRLLGTEDKEVLKDRVTAVREFAQRHNVILVLKGERTLIAEPNGKVVVNPTGNAGLGKAGNGDTLTGIIAGFVAQASQMKVDIFETVVAAVYIAGMAGDIAEKKYGKRIMTASDVRECLGEAFEAVNG